MKDAAALAGWASRAPSWLRTLSLRGDLALPLALLAVQLIGAATFGGTGTGNLFRPPAPVRALDWALLVVGPVALVARRRHPVPVLWVCLAATMASASGLTHVGFVVAGNHDVQHEKARTFLQSVTQDVCGSGVAADAEPSTFQVMTHQPRDVQIVFNYEDLLAPVHLKLSGLLMLMFVAT